MNKRDDDYWETRTEVTIGWRPTWLTVVIVLTILGFAIVMSWRQ